MKPCHLLVPLLALLSAPAGAAIIVVDTLDNELNIDGDCSLREAIVASNTDAQVDDCARGLGDDLIFINAVGTIETPTPDGLPTITDDVEIVGNGGLTIDGRDISPIFTSTSPVRRRT